MATNSATTVTSVLQVILLFVLCTSETSSYTQYQILNSNQLALSSDSRLVLKFAEHAHGRFRRQSDSSTTSHATGASPGDSVNADTPTNFGSGSHALPDPASQPVTPDSSGNGTNSTVSPISTSTTHVTSTSTLPGTTPKVQSTDASTNKEKDPFEDADIIHDSSKYYTSDVIQNRLSEHWIELENAPRHETLSTGHRVAAVINLKFNFYFYGHKVTNVTVATGGFIYMSPFLHQWLTATQYIAPLMANFDPSLSKDSSIYQQNDKNRFIVEWKNMMLKDQSSSGKFHFQTILSDDGTIKFAYKSVPLPITNISTEEHPVKIGLSDAYYNDTYIPESSKNRRTIYEYHKVSLPMSSVTSGSVIVLTPLPTCNRLNDCETCVNHIDVKFDCRWCNTIGRCSDGLDWFRQHWDKEGCQFSHTKDADVCSTLPPPPKPVADPLQHSNSVKDSCLDGKCNKKSELPVAVIVIIVLVVCALLAVFVGWVIYAYKNPMSKSGMWLMEHRPSQIKSRIKFWKSSSDGGAKYKVESEA